MSENFYLRRVVPRTVHDEFHLCKRSAGRRVCFQDSSRNVAEPGARDEAPPACPRFTSVAEVRELLASGEWQIADEYGDVWEPGEESLRKLDELLAWCPDGPSFGEYRDVDGFDFSSWDFR